MAAKKATGEERSEIKEHLVLSRYENLPNKLYIEPKNEEIVETFLSEANEEGKQAETK